MEKRHKIKKKSNIRLEAERKSGENTTEMESTNFEHNAIHDCLSSSEEYDWLIAGGSSGGSAAAVASGACLA